MVGVMASATSNLEMEHEPCNLSLAVDCTLSLGSTLSRAVEAPASRLSRAGSPDPDLALSLSVRSECVDHASRHPTADHDRSEDMSWGSSCMRSDSDATPEYYPQVPERGARDHTAKSSFQAWPWSSYKDEVKTAKTLFSAIGDHKYRNRASRQPYLANYVPSSVALEAKAVEECITMQDGDNCGRVCAHCGTSKTPLWRNGPGGPKSLCNACGIRFKKAGRRSAANGGADLPSSPPPVTKVVAKRKLVDEEEQNQHYWVFPEAKPRKRRRATAPLLRTSDSILSGSCMTWQSSLVLSPKSPLQRRDFPASPPSEISKEKKGSFSSDEEEGAVLLMALSCGRLNG